MPVRKLVNPKRRKKFTLRNRRRDNKGRLLPKKKRVNRARPRPKFKLRPRKKVNRARKLKLNRRRASNPSLVLMGLNPVRSGGRHMKARKKKKNPQKHYALKARARHNMHRRRYSLRRTKNPFGVTWPKVFEQALEVLIGGFGARLLPQYVASQYNNGAAGYGLNAVSTALLSLGFEYFRKGAGLPVALGGLLMTASRIVSDKWGKTLVTFGLVDQSTGAATGTAAVTSPAASTQALSQGDLAFDLRGYKTTYFPLPTVSAPGGITTGVPWSSDLAKVQAMVTAMQAKGHGASASAGFSPGKSVSATSTKKSGRYSMTM